VYRNASDDYKIVINLPARYFILVLNNTNVFIAIEILTRI